jgi:small-conductance mechanosensitive channel
MGVWFTSGGSLVYCTAEARVRPSVHRITGFHRKYEAAGTMETFLSPETIQAWFETARQWLVGHVLSVGMMVQALVVLAAVAAGEGIGRFLRRYVNEWVEGRLEPGTRLERVTRTGIRLLPVAVVIVLLWVASLVLRRAGVDTFLVGLTQTLLVAWVAIKLATSLLLARFWSRVVGATAWVLAALHIVGVLGPALEFLDGLGFSIGKVQLTVLSLFKATIVLFVLLRLGSWMADAAERRLRSVSSLTPSTTVLLSKVVKITLFTVVFLVALNSVGIDFTALAVFSGAVGVGVGFGLQKVVGNFVSGIILLLDKSIKPGDVIQVGTVYGWITDLRGRYVSVVTRDGKEYLIPNEDLITQQVINWSYTNRRIRLKVPVGISYGSDPRKAMDLAVEAANEPERVLKDPGPVCRLMGFGDSSVDLELRFWIEDPQNGTANVRSNILLGIWDRFQEHGIEIPFPQQDVHLDVQDSGGYTPARDTDPDTV